MPNLPGEMNPCSRRKRTLRAGLGAAACAMGLQLAPQRAAALMMLPHRHNAGPGVFSIWSAHESTLWQQGLVRTWFQQQRSSKRGRARGSSWGPRGSAGFGGLALGLFSVAPWLADPRNLDEAYGLARQKKGPREKDAKREVEKPPMQPSFKERIRNMVPYQDIIEQVERNCHGRGGLRRARIQRAKTRRPGDPKPPPPTQLDKTANLLASSRCARFAKASLNSPSNWPDPDQRYPEVAFIGRSNVGKSSLLNMISMFGSIAAVSPMPGKTKTANWFRNRKVKLDIIDMPGYGHSDRAQIFGPAALEFVKQRTSLRCLYVLIDARHGFKRTDHEWLSELGRAGPPKQVILTKCDMVAPKELIKIASLVRSDLEAYKRVDYKVLLCSSVWASGLHDIRKDICRRCGLKDKQTEFVHEPPPWVESPARELPIQRPPPPRRSSDRFGEAASQTNDPGNYESGSLATGGSPMRRY